MKKNQEYRVIRVPEWVYQNIKTAEGLLERKGIDKIPKKVKEVSKCPHCRIDLKQTNNGKLVCERCGFTFPEIKEEDTFLKGLALGSVIGLAVVLLIMLLLGETK